MKEKEIINKLVRKTDELIANYKQREDNISVEILFRKAVYKPYAYLEKVKALISGFMRDIANIKFPVSDQLDVLLLKYNDKLTETERVKSTTEVGVSLKSKKIKLLKAIVYDLNVLNNMATEYEPIDAKAEELQYQENLKVIINKACNKYAVLNDMSSDIYQSNLKRGFDVSKDNIGQTLMLIVSEISEALEADRKGKHAELKLFEQDVASSPMFEDAPDPSIALFEEYIKDSFEDEIADSIIRLLDLCGALKIDIDKHIKYKRNYNESRPYLHGKQY